MLEVTSYLDYLIVYKILFIEKEFERYVFSTFTLTTINLIYTNNLVTLVS
jgi:hypothetical protein